MKLAIVTDSTCDWTLEACRKADVRCVPLKISVGERTLVDQVELDAEGFYDLMQESEAMPQSSQPAPHDFSEVFKQLADEGYEEIVSLHIASVLSGTMQSAQLAAETSPIPVHVVDSRNVSSGMGLMLSRACEMRDAGAGAAEVVEELERMASKTRLFIAPDTMDNLLKGGRATEEQATGAALLNIKLVFTLDERGALVNYDKVKGSKGIVRLLTDVLAEMAENEGPLKVRFLSCRNEKLVSKIASSLEEAGVPFEHDGADACGATIATHLGLGAVGLGVVPASL